MCTVTVQAVVHNNAYSSCDIGTRCEEQERWLMVTMRGKEQPWKKAHLLESAAYNTRGTVNALPRPCPLDNP